MNRSKRAKEQCARVTVKSEFVDLYSVDMRSNRAPSARVRNNDDVFGGRVSRQ